MGELEILGRGSEGCAVRAALELERFFGFSTSLSLEGLELWAGVFRCFLCLVGLLFGLWPT